MSAPPLLLVTMEVVTTKPQAAVELNNSQGRDGRGIAMRSSLLSLRCSRVHVKICAKSARVSDRGQPMLSKDQPSEALFCRERVCSSWTKPERVCEKGAFIRAEAGGRLIVLFPRPAGTSNKHSPMSRYEQIIL